MSLYIKSIPGCPINPTVKLLVDLKCLACLHSKLRLIFSYSLLTMLETVGLVSSIPLEKREKREDFLLEIVTVCQGQPNPLVKDYTLIRKTTM